MNNWFGIIERANVFDYTKSESRAARFARAGLINAIKPFENSAEVFFFYSDPVILNPQYDVAAVVKHRNFDLAVFIIISYGVFHKVFNEFHCVFAFHSDDSVAAYRNAYFFTCRKRSKALGDFGRYFAQIEILGIGNFSSVFEFGKIEHIAYKRHEFGNFLVRFGGERLYFLVGSFKRDKVVEPFYRRKRSF